MTDNSARLRAEGYFARQERQEKAIADAMQLETKRHDAAVENMKRLRELRLSKQPVETAKS
jgi:hypothetical protein